MKQSDRCRAQNAGGAKCILENQHCGPHEDKTAIKWGDSPQCPIRLPNGTRCLRRHGHELPHRMYSGVDFIEYTDEDIARVYDSVVEDSDYQEEWKNVSHQAAIVPLPPRSLARRLFSILDNADDRPFVPISQELIKEVLIALPKEYL